MKQKKAPPKKKFVPKKPWIKPIDPTKEPELIAAARQDRLTPGESFTINGEPAKW